MNQTRVLAGLTGVLLLGCADPDLSLPPADEPAPATCGLADRYEVLSSGHIVEGDVIVGTLDELEAACAAGKPWPAEERTPRGIGVTGSARRWPGGVLVYDIDPALPNPARVLEAMQIKWGTKTHVSFRPKTANDVDYVYVTPGDRCSSKAGRQGGKQELLLTADCDANSVAHELGHAVGLKHEQKRCDRDAFVRIFWDEIISGKDSEFEMTCGSGYQDLGPYNLGSFMHYYSESYKVADSPTMLALVPFGGSVPVSTVVDMSIASTDWVYTWWSDGWVTAGSSTDLELRRSRYRYTLPAGYTPADIVGIGIAKSNDRVYTWYKDGKVSVGNTANLAAITAPYSYSLPPGYSITSIIAMDIASTDKVFTWYSNGKASTGKSSDLDYYAAPYSFTLPSGTSVGQVLGIGIASTDKVFSWSSFGEVFTGSSSDLDAHGDDLFRGRLGWIQPSGEMTAGDIAAINMMYP